MSFKITAYIRPTLAVCFAAVIVQLANAEQQASSKRINIIDDFSTVLLKVENYQEQNQLWQQRQKISELNVKQSKLWQNPTLSIEQDGFGSNQDQELSIGISQPLDIFGQRKLDQKIAQTARQQMQLLQPLWEAKSQLIVRFAWSNFALADAEQQVYAAQLKISQSNLDSAHKRYQAGSIALVDYERSQIEALEAQRLYEQALLNQQASQRLLSNLWGESAASIELKKNVMSWPEQSNENVQRYIAAGWLEKLYALNILQSNQQIERLKIKSRPNPTLNAGITRTKALNEQDDTVLALGVDIPLSLFNRQQYSIPITQRQQILLNQQQQRELKQQILDIANSMHQLQGLRTQFAAASNQISLAEKVQSRTLQGFQAGKLAITDVQQATDQLLTIRLGQLQTLRQAWKAALTAEALSIGTSYEQISSSDAYTQLNKTALEQTYNLIGGGAQ